MTVLDDKLVPKAKELLDKFGGTYTYTQITTGSFDPTTGTTSGDTTTPYSTKMVPPWPVNDKLVDGETYKFGDQLTYIADKDLPFTPVAGRDQVTIGGEVFNVIAARAVRSGDLIAIWELQLRKN